MVKRRGKQILLTCLLLVLASVVLFGVPKQLRLSPPFDFDSWPAHAQASYTQLSAHPEALTIILESVPAHCLQAYFVDRADGESATHASTLYQQALAHAQEEYGELDVVIENGQLIVDPLQEELIPGLSELHAHAQAAHVQAGISHRLYECCRGLLGPLADAGSNSGSDSGSLVCDTGSDTGSDTASDSGSFVNGDTGSLGILYEDDSSNSGSDSGSSIGFFGRFFAFFS